MEHLSWIFATSITALSIDLNFDSADPETASEQFSAVYHHFRLPQLSGHWSVFLVVNASKNSMIRIITAEIMEHQSCHEADFT